MLLGEELMDDEVFDTLSILNRCFMDDTCWYAPPVMASPQGTGQRRGADRIVVGDEREIRAGIPAESVRIIHWPGTQDVTKTRKAFADQSHRLLKGKGRGTS